MRKIALALVSLAIVLTCAVYLPSLFGWGQHHFHAQHVRQIAAPTLKWADGKDVFSKQEWDEFVKLYCYYPDWGGGGLNPPRRPDELWDYYNITLTKNRVDGSHGNHATVQYFKLLIDCLAAGETHKAAVWAGCLTHVIGDAAAANHPPLLAYLTYAYGPMGMTIGTSKESVGKNMGLLDVSGVSNDQLGRKYIQEGLKDYQPALLADNAEEAAIRVQLILQENWLVAMKEEARIARGLELWVGSQDPQGREMLQRGMARLVVKCSRDAADVIFTAVKLAEKKQTFEVDRAQVKARPRILEFRGPLTLAQVSAYDGILREPGNDPAVGVVLAVPAIYWVTAGSVDMQLCYFLSVIANTLAEQKTPYATFDIRHMPATIDPRKTPVLIMPSYYRKADGLATESLEKLLVNYRKAGGRILFVGGHLAPATEPLARSFMRSTDKDGFYPIPFKEMPGKKIVLGDKDGQEAFGCVKIMTDFDTRAFGYYVLKPDVPAEIQPVAFLDTGMKRIPVGAGLVEEGKFRMIYVPWYLFLPGSFSSDSELRRLDQPRLDEGGRKMLKHLLGLLSSR